MTTKRKPAKQPTRKSTRKQDTPGRADASSSRQQTHPDQAEQTGSPHIDAHSRHTAKPKRQEDLASLPTRPAQK